MDQPRYFPGILEISTIQQVEEVRKDPSISPPCTRPNLGEAGSQGRSCCYDIRRPKRKKKNRFSGGSSMPCCGWKESHSTAVPLDIEVQRALHRLKKEGWGGSGDHLKDNRRSSRPSMPVEATYTKGNAFLHPVPYRKSADVQIEINCIVRETPT